MTRESAFICDAVRTPFGRYGGALAGTRTDDLAAVPLKALIARHPTVDWRRLDDVVLGCANQAGEDNRNIARMALLLAAFRRACLDRPSIGSAVRASTRWPWPRGPSWPVRPR